MQVSAQQISWSGTAEAWASLGISGTLMSLAAGVSIAGLFIWAPEASHAAATQQLCRILLCLRTSQLLPGEQPLHLIAQMQPSAMIQLPSPCFLLLNDLS